MNDIAIHIVDVDRLWFTIRDAMKYLGVSRDFIDDQRKKGELDSYIINHTVFLRKSDIDAMIESHKVHPRRSRHGEK